MSNTSLSADWDVYRIVLREDAHQLLAWSYMDTRSRLVEAKDEYEMTGLLADGMDARINSPQTPDKFTLYSIHNEKPTSPSGELGKERPKLDIQIERCGRRPKCTFTFEAKRLRDDAGSRASDSMRQYLGKDGLQRFVKGHYVPESPEAAMLGCIQAHHAEFWFDHIGKEFESDNLNGGTQFATIEPLRHAKIIKDFPDERTSLHQRNRGPAIRIFHLFIDCRFSNDN